MSQYAVTKSEIDKIPNDQSGKALIQVVTVSRKIHFQYRSFNVPSVDDIIDIKGVTYHVTRIIHVIDDSFESDVVVAKVRRLNIS